MCVLENVQKIEHKPYKCESVRNVKCGHLLKSGPLPSERIRGFGTEKERLTDFQVHSDMELDTFWTAMHSSPLF